MAKIKSPLTILRLTFNIFNKENKDIFYPYVFIVFLNLLVFEVLYFAPRYPLSQFFYPIISRMYGQQSVHYPMTLMVLPKMFYYPQMIIFIFFSSFVIATIADMVNTINNDKKPNFKNSVKRTFPSYVYIVLYALLSLFLFHMAEKAYDSVLHRAFLIHSTTGTFFQIKKAIFYATPYVQFLYSILISSILVYIPILIIVEKKKFLGAFLGNFKVLWGSFWVTLTLVLVPTLFYLPLILMRENMNTLVQMTVPEAQAVLSVLGIFIISAIDIFVMAAATSYYLYKKESP